MTTVIRSTRNLMKLKNKCFVLMPFDERFREIYLEVYQPVCKVNNIECWRVDEINRPGSITRDIIEGILDADIIIADLTSKNANVFYELGIAHTVGNKTIMTSQSIDDVPFDIGNFRVILYEQTIAGSKNLYKKLDLAIKELLKALDRTNNPFQEVASSRSYIKVNRKVPLVKLLNYSELSNNIIKYLEDRNIMYAEDINKIDFYDLLNTAGIGKTGMSRFIYQILQHDLYREIETLHKFIVQNKIKPTRWR